MYFRKSCQLKAIDFGLSGSVSNLQDGSVYIEIEGGLKACTQLMLWAETGPELAWVEKLEISVLNPLGSKNFEIIRI